MSKDDSPFEKLVSSGALLKTAKHYWQVAMMQKGLFWSSASTLAFGNVFIRYIPPLLTGAMVNDFITQDEISFNVAKKYIILTGLSWVFGELIKAVSLFLSFRAGIRGFEYLNNYTMNEILKKDYTFFADNFAGSITKKALDYSGTFVEFLVTIRGRVLSELLPIIFVTIILFRFSPWLALIQIVSLLIVPAVSIPIVRHRMRLVRIRQRAGNKVVGVISDIVSNVNATKAFAAEKDEMKSYSKHIADYMKKSLRSWDYNIVFVLAVTPLYVIMNVIALIVVVSLAPDKGIQAGDVLIVFAYFFQYSQFLWSIGEVYRDIEGQLSKGAEFTDMFIDEPAILNAKDATKLKVESGDIEFKDTLFAYEDEGAQHLLNDFNLKIPANQTLGLVGPSGGGKTTLTKLILRFVDINEGSLMVDGQDIRDVTQESLRKSIGYVPQEPLMFHRTITDNIRYGNSSASKEDVVKAAKLANAHEFINELRDGYSTLVGERGIKLSGGQRQRIAIARAFLKNAPILVLDEATSALDSESEKLIQDSLLKLMKGKTAIVIAHRLSTIKHLDRIIVLDNGEIVQDGTHEELSKKKGLYQDLWSHQSGGFLGD